MSRFTLPRDMYYGKGSLEQLKNLKGKRAVLVLGGGSMRKFGFVDRAVSYLKEAGIETVLFENVEPDPIGRNRYEGRGVDERIQTGLDCCHGRRFTDRCGESDVGIL